MRKLIDTPRVKVWEYEPCYRTIGFWCGGGTRFSRLPFPYVIFTQVLAGDSVLGGVFYVRFAAEPMADDFSGMTYEVCLPNVHAGHDTVCLGANATNLKDFISAFWQIRFQAWNYSCSCENSMKLNFGSEKQWRNLTLEDACAKLQARPTTLNDFLHRVVPQKMWGKVFDGEVYEYESEPRKKKAGKNELYPERPAAKAEELLEQLRAMIAEEGDTPPKMTVDWGYEYERDREEWDNDEGW